MGVDFVEGPCENGFGVEQYKSKYNTVCRRCQSLRRATKKDATCTNCGYEGMIGTNNVWKQ
jgi:ribosomal protein L37E